MPRRQKLYHYIYKTTCSVTSKFYVGMHSTDSLEDGYLGSGKVLGYSRKKHGDENHKKEILEFLPSREALKLREREIVNEELLADPLNINLKYGGEGGGKVWNDAHAAKFHKAGYQAMMKKKDLSAASKKTWATAREKLTRLAQERGHLANVYMQTDIARTKRKETFAKTGHAQGENNSQFGTCWITNGLPIKIKKQDLAEYQAKGYRLGRK